MKNNLETAYQKALAEITEKGYNTYATVCFQEDHFYGMVIMTKKATLKAPVKVNYKIKRFGIQNFLTVEAKQIFFSNRGFRLDSRGHLKKIASPTETLR